MKFLFSAVIAAMAVAPAPAQDAVTRIVDLEPGADATVRGIVEAITDDDEFRIADSSRAVIIYIGEEPVPVVVGEALSVSGVVDDDVGSLELYARRLTRAAGSVVTFDHADD